MENENLKALAVLLEDYNEDLKKLNKQIKWLKSKVNEYYFMLPDKQRKQIAKKTNCECQYYGMLGKFYTCDGVYLPCDCVGGV